MFLRYHFFWRVIFFIIDLIFLNASIIFACYLTQQFLQKDLWTLVGTHLLVFNLIWFVLIYWRDYYSTNFKFIQITKDTVEIAFIHLFFVMLYLFSREQIGIPRLFISSFYVCFFAGLLLIRYTFIILHNNFGFFESDKRRVAIIGRGAFSSEAAKFFKQPDSGYEFVGIFDNIHEGEDGYPVLGSVEDCMKYAEENDIQELYSTILPASSETLQALVHQAEKKLIRVKFIPDFNMLFYRNVNLSVEHNIPVISFRNEPLELMKNRILKRLFDVAFSAVVTLTLLWWLVPIIAIIIRLNSKGPIFFVQKRSGRNGEEFNCLKFRTMYVNNMANEMHAQKNDSRITNVGAFLRKTSLDELPQFFNVLMGDMSVVGPRPHMLKHTEEYRQLISKFMVRHYLKPGITGWAQVNGYRGDLNREKMKKRVVYDIWYLENWSFLLDLKIIIQTVYGSVKGDENAY